MLGRKLLSIVFALAVLTITFAPQTRVHAVNSQVALINAIQNAASGATIILTGDINVNCAVEGTTYFGPDGRNAFPSITQNLTIDGAGFTIDRNSANSCRFFHVAGGGNLTLEDITLLGGVADIPMSNGGLGGGIFNRGTLNIVNSAISDNIAEFDGGGFFNLLGTVTVTNSSFGGNEAGFDGGGFYNDRGIAALTDTTISANEATNGGGFYSSFATTTLIDTTISDNTATNFGGGFYIVNGTATVTDSVISANDVINFSGGGFRVDNGTVNLTGSTISGNTTPNNGGGFFSDNGTVVITASGINSNEAGLGGGFYNFFGAVTLIDTTVNGNGARFDGGGFYNDRGEVNSNNTTVSNNTAERFGGSFSNISTTVTLTDTTVSGNEAEIGGGFYNNSGTVNANNSIINDNDAGTGGGFYNNSGTVNVSNNSTINENEAEIGGGFVNVGTVTLDTVTISDNFATSDSGGAIYNVNGSININNSFLTNNLATLVGGAIFNADDGTVTVTGSRFFENSATQGGAVFSNINQTSVTGSCFIGNSDTAFFNNTQTVQDATGNWWGAIDGPGGVGPGSGDSVGEFVDFSGFLTEAPDDCPTALPIYTSDPVPGSTFALAGEAGSTQSAELTVTNTGDDVSLLSVSLASISAGYAVDGLPIAGLLPTDAAVVLAITCTVPQDAGMLTLNANAPGQTQVTYSLTCVADEEPEATPDPTDPVDPPAVEEPAFIPAQPEDLGVVELPATGERPLWAELLRR